MSLWDVNINLFIMKTNYLLICSVALSATLFSCGGSETAEAESTESGETAEVEAPAPKQCKLKSYSFQLGEKSRTLSFNYEGESLKSLAMTEQDSEDAKSLDYMYDESGKMTSFSMEGSKATYVYDANGRLTEIKGEGSLNTRTFEYDDQGRMTKQITMFGGKPYTTHIYSYENDIPTKVDLMMKGELYESYALVFDDKKNPLMNKGIFANGTEMMLGYAVANFQHNIVSVTSTNKKGESDTRQYSYEYDENGYPTKEKRKRGEQEIVTEYVYECQ